MQIEKLISMALLWIVLGLGFPILGNASHPPEDIPIFTDVQVEAAATFDPSTRFYTYVYTLTNPATNTTEIFFWLIDTATPLSSLPLPTDRLVLDGGSGLDGTRILIPFDDEFSSIKGLNLDLRIVPVGTSISGTNADSGLTIYNSLQLSSEPGILPGTSFGTFQVFSPGLPTIRAFAVHPNFVPTMEPGDDCPEDVETHCGSEESAEGDLQILSQLINRGRTLGPTAPPAVFDSVVFLETIRGYVAESQTLGWLTDAGLAAALNGALDAAVTGLSSNDVGATKTAILAFIAALPVPPAGTTACSTECAGLLYFNAQYLLDQLPTEPDLTVTQVSASQGTVAAGANVDVTVTVYNAGGGDADSSSARLLLSSDTTADLGDTSLGDIAVPALALGASATITTTVTVPSTTPSGAYTLGACADSTGTVTEISEENNCAAGGTLTVILSVVPNASPISSLPPIVSCPQEGDCAFLVPATDPDGDPLRFRMSTAEEAGGAFVQPGPPHAPHAAEIDPNLGLYTWNTRGATRTANPTTSPNTLYSTQVMIEELSKETLAPKGRVAVDFLIQLLPSPETCDGLDNDLDGLADEGFPDTDGDRTADCVDLDDDNDGFSDVDELAAGSDPLNADSTLEVCDGFDNDLDGLVDEGFPDTDGDGVADCRVTDDADGDGIPDASDACESSNLSATVVVNGCDSGVPNTVLSNGCTISDSLVACAADQFVSCVSHVTNDLKNAGTITGQQKGAIQSCTN
jgi:hypothetical protein